MTIVQRIWQTKQWRSTSCMIVQNVVNVSILILQRRRENTWKFTYLFPIKSWSLKIVLRAFSLQYSLLWHKWIYIRPYWWTQIKDGLCLWKNNRSSPMQNTKTSEITEPNYTIDCVFRNQAVLMVKSNDPNTINHFISLIHDHANSLFLFSYICPMKRIQCIFSHGLIKAEAGKNIDLFTSHLIAI